MSVILNEVKNLLENQADIRVNESMKKHTSFKIGGKCALFVIPKTLTAIKNTIDFANQNNLPLLIIGNGTNLLFPDTQITGIIMRIGEPYFCEVQKNGSIKAQAGISIDSLLDFTSKQGLSGLEFMAGIPGTLGGAITMNAGAYGKRIGELITQVEVMDKKGKTYELNNSEIGFGYRESRFSAIGGSASVGQSGDEIILSATLELKPTSVEAIQTKIQEILDYREVTLPLAFPSAGCVFKNPQEGPAGKFIELAGCKGLKIGDAEVSAKHANFIINKGKATCKDVKLLITEIQKRVYEKFKISLELEIRILSSARGATSSSANGVYPAPAGRLCGEK